MLNGTSNYILTRMQAAGLDFATALAEAQALGYAEADLSLDVDGTDAAHKLTLLAANALACPRRWTPCVSKACATRNRATWPQPRKLGYVVSCWRSPGAARRAWSCACPAWCRRSMPWPGWMGPATACW